MIITVDKVTIAHNFEIPVEQLEIDGEFAEDVAELLRAKSIRIFERGNEQTTINLSTTRLFTSIYLAERFVLRHRIELPRQGLVTLITDIDGPREQYYIDAATVKVKSRYIGATTFHSYQILGGAISLKRPT